MPRVTIERAPLPPPYPAEAARPPGHAHPAPRVHGAGQASGARRPGQEPDRDAFLDNAKYLTIVLVAVGHVWAPLTTGSRTASALYYLLYSFHMPAFVIISGYLSRGYENSPRQVRRLVTGLVVPYVVFQTVYVCFLRWTGGDTDREFGYQAPGFAMWFLVALFLWRLTAPVWKLLRHPLPVSVAVAVAASVTPSIDGDLSLMRVAQFLPFFVLGLRLGPGHFRLVRHRTVRVLAVPVAAVALLVSYWSVPVISGAPFLHDKNAQELGLPAWLGAVMTLASFGCATVMTVCFLAWVPRRHTWFTALGAGTLYAYLLHICPVRIFQQSGLYGTDWAMHPLGRVVITLLAAAAMTALCTAPVRRAFRFVLGPRMAWFFAGETGTPSADARDAPGTTSGTGQSVLARANCRD